MPYSEKTPFLELPIYSGSDAPATREDVNYTNNQIEKNGKSVDGRLTETAANILTIKAVADEANEKSDTAIEKADTATAVSTEANDNALIAQEKADGAIYSADAANETANEAKNIAEGIDEKATDALAASENAVSAANAATQKAASADEKATAIATDLSDNYYDKTASDYRYPQKKYRGIMIGTGDSIAKGTLADTSFYTTVAGVLGELTLKNYAENQAGFTFPGNDGSSTILQQLQKAAADSSFNNDDVSLVFISGGHNDSSNTGTTHLPSVCQAAASECVTYALNNFKNAEIYCIPYLTGCVPLTRETSSPGGALVVDQKYRWYNSIYQGFKNRGNYRVHILDGAYSILTGQPQYVNDDTTHPNTNGQTVIARHIINAVCGSVVDLFPNNHASVALTNVVSNDISYCEVNTKNGVTHLQAAFKIKGGTPGGIGQSSSFFRLPPWASPSGRLAVPIDEGHFFYIGATDGVTGSLCNYLGNSNYANDTFAYINITYPIGR